MSDGMRELELAGVIDGAESSILPGLTPTPHDIARAVIAAGWVSPEQHARTAAVAQRDEAEKGRLWQHLRDRCATAEAKVARVEALIEHLRKDGGRTWISSIADDFAAELEAPDLGT